VPKTTNQRQADYRERKQEGGLRRRKDLYVTCDDGILTARIRDVLPTMTLEELNKRLLEDFNEPEIEVVYHELYEYVKEIKKNLTKAIYPDQDNQLMKLLKLRKELAKLTSV